MDVLKQISVLTDKLNFLTVLKQTTDVCFSSGGQQSLSSNRSPDVLLNSITPVFMSLCGLKTVLFALLKPGSDYIRPGYGQIVMSPHHTHACDPCAYAIRHFAWE